MHASSSRRDGRRTAIAPALAATALTALLAASGAQAQVGVTAVQRSFINLSFEQPSLQTVGCRVYIGEQFVPGWTTTHANWGQENSGGCVTPPGFVVGQQARILELWRTPRNNGGLVNARSGSQLAELNAEQLSRIYQNVCLVQGDVVQWRFSHRGRASATVQDRMQFLIGASPIVEVGTTNNGTGGVIRTPQGSSRSVAGPDGWRDYSGTFNYNGVGGVTNIGFEALSGAATTGNFLDDIQVYLRPFIELDGNAYSTVEGQGGTGLPSLALSGVLENPLDVIVQVVGGTAVLGTDFTTPSGTASFTVRIPAGTYDGTQSQALGLAAIGNSLIDGSRTVQLRLQPDPANYFTLSTRSCGGAGVTDATWTILDDDLDLAITKTADVQTARPGDSIGYTLSVTHLAGVSGNGAVVRDPAVAGLDCSAATISCTASGNAVCPVSPTIAALQSAAGLAIPTLPSGGRVDLSFRCVVPQPAP
jgi:uncharacterized repeat protein (TIGR01451 family)